MPDALSAFLFRGLGAALTFALHVVLARLMAVNDYGHFALVWSWALALGSFASLGFNDLTMRLLPRYGVRSREKAAAEFVMIGFRFTALVAVVACAIAAASTWLFRLEPPMALIIASVCLALPLLAMEFFLGSVARAMGWMKLGIGTAFILRPALIMLAALGLVLGGIELTGSIASLLLAFGLAASTAVMFFVTRKRLKLPIARRGLRHGARWLRSALPMWLAGALDDMLAYADVVLVGLLLTPADAAIYFAASRVLTPAALVQYAFFYVTPRLFSQSIAVRDSKELSRRYWRATLQAGAATTAAVLLVLLAAPLLLWLFGEAYGDAWHLLPLLAVSQIARAISGQAQELLVLAGRSSLLSWVNGLTLALLAMAMAVLVPVHGNLGATAAVAAVFVLRSIGLLLAAQHVPQLRVSHAPA